MIPEHLSNYGLQWFVGELLFVALLIAGMVHLWSGLRPLLLREGDAPWAVAAEAIIVIPWLVSGALFCGALLGGFRSVLVAAQIGLAVAGIAAIWTHRHAARSAITAAGRMLRESWVTLAAVAAVALFVYWGWVVPFPDPANGHHHGTLNLISELWRDGGYPELPKPWIGYETAIFTPPAANKMILSLFAVPGIESVGTRPVFLVPGVFALFTLQLMRLTCVELAGRAALGSVAFLLCAFSYSAIADFTDVTLDYFTPVLLAYFGLHVARMVVSAEAQWFPFVLFAVVAAVVRSQVLLLGLGLAAALVVARLVPWRDLWAGMARGGTRARTAAIALVISLPFLAWAVYMIARYENLAYAARVATGRYESATTSGFGLFNFETILDAKLDGQNYLLSQFLPAFVDRGLSTFVKNALAGLSFSILLTVAIVAFVVLAKRAMGGERGRLLRRLALAYALGFAAVMYLAFPVYPKFTHYAAFLLAPFGAILIGWIARSGRLGKAAATATVAAVFVAGVAYGAYNTWGHTSGDSGLTNVKMLYPGYGDALDRLARATGRPRESLAAELAEYETATGTLGRDEHVLLVDLEPGALVPSIADRRFLGAEPYLTTERADDVLAAETPAALRDALRAIGVRYVYQPGRDHPPDVEDSLIMRRLAAYDGDSEFVIPVDELVARGPRP